MSKLFQHYPKVEYGTKIATNLTTRLRLRETIFERFSSYYPYYIKEGERPDMVSFNYYDDSTLMWLIFLVNDIVDPYFDWPMTDLQLQRVAVKKYGSVPAADSLNPPAYYVVVDGVESYLASADSYNSSYDGDVYGRGSGVAPEGNFKNYSITDIYSNAVTGVNGVSHWQRMKNENADKRTIQLLDKRFVPDAIKEMKTLLKDG